MGSAAVQGQLWGAHPQDFAEYLEQVALPLHGAALDAARVTRGTRLLDAGCGAGLATLLASLRGATVTALDASAGLLAVARARLPEADVREGDLEALPFADATFDAVVAVNSIFYAADMGAALRELARVVRPGGRVVATAWGPPERCEAPVALIAALGPLMPPPPPGASAGHPGVLSEPGALAAVLTEAGLRVVEQGEVACPFVYPSAEAAWRAAASAGPNQVAIAHSGEAAVRAALAEADRAYTRPDGSIRYENVFLWVAGERPY
ncbi:MAG TPA: class I SAM-dependent methyltransferase [Chloroflexota bacterium]|nr:class I SAM-dependent methyltransferase [Chloroflexota bacterium]